MSLPDSEPVDLTMPWPGGLAGERAPTTVLAGRAGEATARLAGTADGPFSPTGDPLEGVPIDSAPAWVRRVRDEGHPSGTIRHYELGPLLGEGGFGQVFLAYDPALNREVALKLMIGKDRSQVARMLREARAQARVDHPAICRILEAGEWEGQPYIVMPCIRGRTLEALSADLNFHELAGVYASVCEGLHAAHAQGLVHRDIKPANIMVERDPGLGLKPFLMDFGLVRDDLEPQLTSTGMIMGTPAFMSPEQARGEGRTLDARADIYSLGASLYASLAGRSPFSGAPMDVLVRVITEEPPRPRILRPDLPADLETLILRAMDKRPEARFSSAAVLAGELRRFLLGQAVQAKRVTSLERAWRWMQRNPRLAALSSLSLLLLAGLGAQAAGSAYRTRVQNRLSLAFALMAERAENTLRTARLRPLHDTTVERRAALTQMAEIQRRARLEGRLAEAPAKFALGKAALAMGDLPMALGELQAAWAAGFRSEEVSMQLGRAFALTYEAEVRDLTGQARKDRARELDASLRQPAILHLGRGRASDPMAAALGEALLLRLEADPARSLASVRRARRLSVWNDEAWQLEGEILLDEARSFYERGDYGQARVDVVRAAEACEAALRVAPSSPEAYAALARIQRWRLNLEGLESHSNPATLAAGLQACRQGLQADPGNAELPGLEGLLCLRWSETNGRLSPTARGRLLERAIGVLAESDRRDATAESKANLAWAQSLHGEWLEEQGRDPALACGEAIRHGRAAFSLRPGHERATYWTSASLRRLAESRARSGDDPIEQYREAAGLLESLFRNHPRDQTALLLGTTLADLARWESHHGLDPRATLHRALTALRAARGLDPHEPASAAMGLKVRLELSALDEAHSLGASEGNGPAEGDAWLEVLRQARHPEYRALQRQWQAQRGVRGGADQPSGSRNSRAGFRDAWPASHTPDAGRAWAAAVWHRA